MTMFNYFTGQTQAQEEAARRRRNQDVDQSTSMLSPGTSPSAITGGLLEQQQSFIPQGTFEPNPDVLQNIVASRTQEVLPENRQVDIGGQTVVGGTAPVLDAAGISNMAAQRGTGIISNPQGSFPPPLPPPPPPPPQGASFGRGQGFEGLEGLYTNIPGFESGPSVSVGDLFVTPTEGFNLGQEGATVGDALDKITDSDQYQQMLRDQGTPIVTDIIEDIEDPNKESTEESLEDGAGTGKDGPAISTFDNANLKSLETQIGGLNTGLGVQTSEALTSAYSSGRAAVESAGADTVFLNKFFKQLSQPLQFNENGSPKLPEFPGELLQQLTRNIEQTVPNPAFLALDPQDAVAAGIPDTITTVVPTLDPAGELLLDFYNEYIGNALLMAREAQKQKNELAVAEAQANPFGLTAQDQLEIEKLRTNPFGLTAEQALSLERQGLSADDFIELELEKQRIGARPNLIQAISGFFQPGTVAALGGTQNVEGLLSRLGAFDGAREVIPTVIEQLGGGTTQAAPISQNYLQSLVGRVPDDVLSSLETGVPLTSARLAQLERENPTALQIYLGNLAGQGTTQNQAVLESLGRTPGVQNRRASQIGAVVS
tara:strand:- start:7297 stop:9096 length:1800 start_codon:yes stop_codon:yes gene_type:complete